MQPFAPWRGSRDNCLLRQQFHFPLLLNKYVQYFIYIRLFTFCQFQCVASHQYNCQNTVCGWFVLGMRTYCPWTLSSRKERCVTKWKYWIRRGQRFSFVPRLGQESGGEHDIFLNSFFFSEIQVLCQARAWMKHLKDSYLRGLLKAGNSLFLELKWHYDAKDIRVNRIK